MEDTAGAAVGVSVRLECSEDVADDFLLPVDQFKRLFIELALGMFQLFDEGHHEVGSVLVVMRRFQHERTGRILFQLAHSWLLSL